MLNRITVMGRLTIDPELRTTNGGTTVCSFPVACDRDDKEKKTDFFDVVAFGQSAEFASKWLQKGRLVCVEGQLRVNEWTDKDGKRRKSYNIKADRFYFADGKRQDPQPPQLEPYTEDDRDLPF